MPGRLFGFPDIELHYGSVTYATSDRFWRLAKAGALDQAAAVHPLWQVALIAAGGLVVTYATALGCYWYATRRLPHPFIIALGLIATFRFVAAPVILLVRAFVPGAQPSSDETNVAILTPIPEWLLLTVGALLLWLVWWRMLRSLSGAVPRRTWTALGLGIAGGGALYLLALGPWVLP